MMMEKFESKAIRIQTGKTQYREHSTPLFPTSSFTYESAEQMASVFAAEEEGYIYSRFINPNNTEFEAKLAALEGTESCFATASGMSAVFASFMAFLNAGDHIIASRAIFGSTYRLMTNWLTRWNIEHDFVDGKDPESWEKAVKPNTKLLYLETPSNPSLEIIDLESAYNFCKKHDLLYLVDNCFATPYIQKPKQFGADLVIHSATKFIDGQGRVLGGAVCGDQDLITQVKGFCRATGPSLSPFNAWILSKSLETLSIRMEKHSSNALTLAKELESWKELTNVKYPFLETHPQYEIAKKQMSLGGGVVSFELDGGLESGKTFLNNLKMLSLTANLGDSRSIASHPASTTHAKLTEEQRSEVGITPGLIRISTGLEHIDDIIQDIKQAVEKI